MSNIVFHSRVVHWRKKDYDVYIGRPGPYGNPFREPQDGSRLEVIEKFQDWFLSDDPKAIVMRGKAEKELPGKILGCWCRPCLCHGDVIAAYVDSFSSTRGLMEGQGSSKPKIGGSNPPGCTKK